MNTEYPDIVVICFHFSIFEPLETTMGLPDAVSKLL